MIRRHPEPFLWLLFSAGGVLSAMLMPILLLLFGIAFPFGWVAAPSHAQMLAVLGNPALDRLPDAPAGLPQRLPRLLGDLGGARCATTATA